MSIQGAEAPQVARKVSRELFSEFYDRDTLLLERTMAICRVGVQQWNDDAGVMFGVLLHLLEEYEEEIKNVWTSVEGGSGDGK